MKAIVGIVRVASGKWITSEIRESGDEGRPVECINYEEGYAKLIIGSGEYYFTSRI